MEGGAQVLDTRSPHQFCEGHIPGAVDVFLRGSAFATRAGFVISPESLLLLVVEDERDLHDAITQLAVVGFDQVMGYLDGGMGAWREAGLPVQQLQQMSIDELYEAYQGQMILDVRDKSEWDEGHIKGAKHIPYYFLEERYHELDNSRPLAVICASGQRSTLACSILQKHGFTQLLNVLGGMDTWNGTGFETVRE
jgi:hydroxyacylglutathione hydrolase